MASRSTMTAHCLSLVIGLSALASACAPFPRNSAPGNGHGGSLVASDRDSYRDPADPASSANAPNRTFLDINAIEADAPQQYAVVKGDTLWDIADRFLKEPWRWTELWSYNPQINNPHLIYPGDVLTLEYINGTPTLILTRHTELAGAGDTPELGAAMPEPPRTRLSPRIRSESLNEAIPTIAADSIRQFLAYPRVVDTATVEQAAYVLANQDRSLISSLGNQIYVRGPLSRDQANYGVYRPNKLLKDPLTGEHLGQELLHVSDATLLNIGDPSTLMITRSKMETIQGDILLPSNGDSFSSTFSPRVPELNGDARIISLINAISQTGSHQIVVLNVGDRSKIKEGDVLAIESAGDRIVDKNSAWGSERVTLPNVRTGVLMVFKTFDKVSYGLVMESTRPVTINDIVTGI